jgi:predicted phosphodiesterase
MRIAALYDIHGNLPALEAFLEEVHDAGIDQVVVGGDVVPGPIPRDTLACLLNLRMPVQFIYGNGEVAVLEDLAGRVPRGVPERYRPVVHWTAQQLHPEYQATLAAWPKTLRIQMHAFGDVLFCHGTPRDENECFTRLTPEDRLGPMFQGVDAAVVVCGHTHMQFDRAIGSKRIINAGSVGMPFGQPGADWLLLGPDVQLRHTEYDLQKAAERIRRTTYPQAEEVAAEYVLKTPSEATMLEVFTRASMG